MRVVRSSRRRIFRSNVGNTTPVASVGGGSPFATKGESGLIPDIPLSPATENVHGFAKNNRSRVAVGTPCVGLARNVAEARPSDMSPRQHASVAVEEWKKSASYSRQYDPNALTVVHDCSQYLGSTGGYVPTANGQTQ